MPTARYPVLSPHYDGKPAIKKLGSAMDILPEKIITGRTFVPPTVSQFADRWSPLLIGDDVVTVTSSGRKYHTHHSTYVHHGPNTGQIDDNGMTGFKYASEKVNPSRPENSIIPTMPEVLYMEGTRLGLQIIDGTPVDLQTSAVLSEAVPLRKIGVYASKTADMKIKLHSMMKGGEHYDEARDWIEFLGKKGLVKETSPIVGYGTAKWDKYAAGFFPNDSLVAREYDFRKWARNFANKYGVDGKDAIDAFERAILQHEIAHKWVGGDRRGERIQGKLQKDFYSMMSRKYAGTRKGVIYQALSEEAADYERFFSKKGNFIDAIFGEERARPGIPSSLMLKMEVEARELGLSGHEKHAYIHARLSEVLGAARPYYKESSHNAKRALAGKSSSKPKEKNLDEIVSEESESGENRQAYSKRNTDNVIYAKERFQTSKYEKGKAARGGKKSKGNNKKSEKAKAA